MNRSNEELAKFLARGDGLSSSLPSNQYLASTQYGDDGTLGAYNKVVIAMVGLPARGEAPSVASSKMNLCLNRH